MKHLMFAALLIFIFTSCGAPTSSSKERSPKVSQEQLDQYETAYFASGCFWCVEAVYESVKGVKEAVSGYSGGKEQNPTYKQVSAGITGHSETVKVYYDPTEVSFQTLVKVYYGSQNPTTVNGQHPDYGTQYRSIIFYQTEKEKQIAESFRDSLDASGKYDQPIATEIIPFEKFWEAEEYHQDFEKRNPNQSYVRSVSIPRLKKFQSRYPELLKDDVE